MRRLSLNKLAIFAAVFAVAIAIIVLFLVNSRVIADAPASEEWYKHQALIWKNCIYYDNEDDCTKTMSDGPGWRGFMEDNYLKYQEYANQEFYKQLRQEQ
jgi:hypothetical protein